MRFPLLMLILSFITPAAHPQKYVWPTEASQYMTSSFCEFRPRHYHAAIDIKTWQRTGYKIFAVADGYVYRLRVASTGYGKAIYLKLKDGNFVVYGHLAGFTKKLQDYADARRLAMQKNILDIYPEPSRFPVEKGQHIGYTGDTGIGVPHLHFEIRDQYHQPVNPLQFYRNIVKDKIAPKSNFLAVIPRGAKTFINFQPDTLILPLLQRNEVKLDEPIYLTGKAYLAMRSYDMANGVPNQFDFYRSEMFINDSLAYEIRYDRFNYDQTRIIEIDKNFSLWRRGLRVFHNFYRHPANDLPFYGKFPGGAGLLTGKNLNEGENLIRINVYDYAGNVNTVEIPLIYHRILPFTAYSKVQVNQELLIGLKSEEPLQRFEVRGVTHRLSDSQHIHGTEIRLEEKILGDYYYHLAIPNPHPESFLAYRIQPYYRKNTPSLPFYVESDTTRPLQLAASEIPSLKFYGGAVTLRNKGTIVAALAKELPEAFHYQYQPNAHYLAFPVEALADPLTAEKLDRALVKERLSEWKQIVAGRTSSVRSTDGVVTLYFPENAVYDTIYVRVRKLPVPFPLEQPYRYFSQMYEVRPFDEPLNYGANLTVILPDSIAAQRGIGIYYYDRRKGWMFLPAKAQPGSGNALSARVTSLEKFVMIQDTVAPQLYPLNLMQFNHPVSRKPALKFRIRDEMSGMYNENQIRVEIDNRWSLFEFDPEEDLIILYPRFIPPGQHELKIQVTDNAGNRRTERFNVLN